MRETKGIILTIAFGLIGVVGIVVSIVLFQIDREYRELSYLVEKKGTIKLNDEISNLNLYFQDRIIREDVSVINVHVFSSGKILINKENIFENIEIIMEAEIIDASIHRMSRDSIGFEINNSKLSENSIGISWEKMDMNDGAILQILYIGDSNEIVKIKGSIEGRRKIKEYKPAGINLNLISLIISVLLTIIPTAVYLEKKYKILPSKKKPIIRSELERLEAELLNLHNKGVLSRTADEALQNYLKEKTLDYVIKPSRLRQATFIIILITLCIFISQLSFRVLTDIPEITSPIEFEN